MDSKLVEEIVKVINNPDIPMSAPIKEDAYQRAPHYLSVLWDEYQRCLESLRWKYSPEEPTETGDYLVETEDEYGDVSFEIMHYKVSKAFGSKWVLLGNGYTLVRWLPIPQ